NQGGATQFTGNWVINGGVVQLSAAGGLGVGSALLNAGGELSLSQVANMTNPVTLNGGTLGSSTASVGTFTAPITVIADSALRLGDFFGTGASTLRNMNIASNISGTGSLLLVSSTAGRNSFTNPGGQVLLLTGNNAGYTGSLVLAPSTGGKSANYQVRYVQINNPTAAANSVVQHVTFSAPTPVGTIGLPVVLYDSNTTNDTGNSFSFIAPPTILGTT